MYVFRCVTHSVQRNLRDYITLKTIRKPNTQILPSNSTDYIYSLLLMILKLKKGIWDSVREFLLMFFV